jgi:hypothetical protein
MDLKSGRPAPCSPAFRGDARCLSAVVSNSRQPRNSIPPFGSLYHSGAERRRRTWWGGIKSLNFSDIRAAHRQEQTEGGIKDG